MAVRRLLAATVLLGGFVALANSGPTAALSCSEWPLDQALREAEIVFIGVQLDPSLRGSDQEHVFAAFDVESVVQGDVPERLDLILDPWAGPAQRDSAGREVVFAYTDNDGVVRQSAGCAPPATPSGVERMLGSVPSVESEAPAAVLLIGDLGWADVATLDRDGLTTGLAYLPELPGGAIVCEGSVLAFTGFEAIDLRTLEVVETRPNVEGPVWCSGTDPNALEVISLVGRQPPDVLHHADGRTTRGTFTRIEDRDDRGDWTMNNRGDVLMTWRATRSQPGEIQVLRRGEELAESIVEFEESSLPRSAALDESGDRVAVTVATAAYLYDNSHSHRIEVFDATTGDAIATIRLLGDDGEPIEVIDSAETFYALTPRPYESIGPPLWVDADHLAVERTGESRQLDVYEIASGERISSKPLDASTRLWMYPHAEVPARSIAFFVEGRFHVIDLPDGFTGSTDLVFDGPVVRATNELDIPTLRSPTPLPRDTTTTSEAATQEEGLEAPPATDAPDPAEPGSGGVSLVLVAVVGLVGAGLGFWWSFRPHRKRR